MSVLFPGKRHVASPTNLRFSVMQIFVSISSLHTLVHSLFTYVGTCFALHLTLIELRNKSWLLSRHTYTTIRRNFRLQARPNEASTPKPYRKQASLYHRQNQNQAACSSTPKTSIDIRIPTSLRKSLQWAFRRSMVLVSSRNLSKHIKRLQAKNSNRLHIYGSVYTSVCLL